jgi:hypothetical protein
MQVIKTMNITFNYYSILVLLMANIKPQIFIRILCTLFLTSVFLCYNIWYYDLLLSMEIMEIDYVEINPFNNNNGTGFNGGESSQQGNSSTPGGNGPDPKEPVHDTGAKRDDSDNYWKGGMGVPRDSIEFTKDYEIGRRMVNDMTLEQKNDQVNLLAEKLTKLTSCCGTTGNNYLTMNSPKLKNIDFDVINRNIMYYHIKTKHPEMAYKFGYVANKGYSLKGPVTLQILFLFNEKTCH